MPETEFPPTYNNGILCKRSDPEKEIFRIRWSVPRLTRIPVHRDRAVTGHREGDGKWGGGGGGEGAGDTGCLHRPFDS